MGNRSPIMNRMEEFTSGIGILHQSLLMSPWKNARRPSTNELTLFTSFSSPASTPPPGSASCFTNCLILFLPFHPAHNIGLATCTNKPLFIGISLPLIRCCPWSLRLERRLHEVFKTGEGDGGDILCKLLRIPGRVGAVSDDVARQLLRMPEIREIPTEDASGCGGEPVVQAEVIRG